MYLLSYSDAGVAVGDTFRTPAFAAWADVLLRYDYVVAIPLRT